MRARQVDSACPGRIKCASLFSRPYWRCCIEIHKSWMKLSDYTEFRSRHIYWFPTLLFPDAFLQHSCKCGGLRWNLYCYSFSSSQSAPSKPHSGDRTTKVTSSRRDTRTTRVSTGSEACIFKTLDASSGLLSTLLDPEFFC
jgi:hypothetical protein